MDISVSFRPELQRFEITADGAAAGILEYQLRGSTATMYHTEVYPAFGGRGLGGRLARAALDEARSAGWTVVPTCSFVAGYIESHPEYEDLLAAG